MTHSQLIERYARDPNKLNAREREQVEALLRTDPPSAQLFAFFRAFYRELDSVGDEPLPGEEPLVQGILFPPSPLLELQPRPREPFDPGTGRQLEAAFASADDAITLNVQVDIPSNTIRFRFISGRPCPAPFLVVHFPAVDLLVVIDASKTATIPFDAAWLDPSLTSQPAVLRLPSLQSSLTKRELGEGGVTLRAETIPDVAVTLEGDRLRFRSMPRERESSALTFVVVSDDDGR